MEINIGETTPILASASTNENLSTPMQEINEAINILARTIPTLNDDIQLIRRNADQLRALVASLITHSSEVRSRNQEQNARINGIQHDQETLQQDLTTLQQTVEERQNTSYDGTLAWRITNVSEKLSEYSKKRFHSYG
jgi:chromosome segregation ATPase